MKMVLKEQYFVTFEKKFDNIEPRFSSSLKQSAGRGEGELIGEIVAERERGHGAATFV